MINYVHGQRFNKEKPEKDNFFIVDTIEASEGYGWKLKDDNDNIYEDKDLTSILGLNIIGYQELKLLSKKIKLKKIVKAEIDNNLSLILKNPVNYGPKIIL